MARRGELETPLPVGFVYTPDKRAVLAPDARVQPTLRRFFATFRSLGSAMATVKAFRADEIEHRDAAVAAGAEEAVGHEVLTGAIKAGSRLAIWLSERI